MTKITPEQMIRWKQLASELLVINYPLRLAYEELASIILALIARVEELENEY